MTTTGSLPSSRTKPTNQARKKARHTEAAVLFEIGKPLRIVSLQIPDLKPGQVLVEVAYSGVCGSQLNEIRGLKGPDPYLPHTLGHEGSGIVVEVGEGVSKVKPGDQVVLSWIKGKGADIPSTIYQSKEGPIHSGAISTFMRQTVTCENRVTPISKRMPLQEAALLGCAVCTGAGVIFNTAKVIRGSSVAIFGMGGIGMSALLAADYVGASPIIAIDILDSKLEDAKKIGATHVVQSGREDPISSILEITGGRGVDYAIEASGQREAMETAFKSVRDKGGLCVVAGNLSQGERISLDPFDLIKGKKIIGTWGGEVQPDRDIPMFIDLFLKGAFKLDHLIGDSYLLLETNQALRELKRGIRGRALVHISKKPRRPLIGN